MNNLINISSGEDFPLEVQLQLVKQHDPTPDCKVQAQGNPYSAGSHQSPTTAPQTSTPVQLH